MKVALVYDRVNKIGGAERVLAALHQIWPEAPLYTAVYNPKTATWAQEIQVIPSFLQKFPFAVNHHEWFPLITPYAFESFDVSDFDVIISVTSADAKAVITSPRQLHLCYLLTPTRYLWSHADFYAGDGFFGNFRKHLITGLKQWDMVAASRPDQFIAISQAVADRCQNYYHRKAATIIYPPVNTDTFKNHPQACSHPLTPYFLTVSRLVPYKRTDLAIQACNALKQNLIIVGDGSERKRLKNMAGPTIHFMGQISDERLACLYHHAEALIFPQEEEFGITAVEAQSAGIPVIAFQQGGAQETIRPGVTGILFKEQSVDSLSTAILALKNHTWYDKTIQEHARLFDNTCFTRKFRSYVEDAWKNHQKECEL